MTFPVSNCLSIGQFHLIDYCKNSFSSKLVCGAFSQLCMGMLQENFAHSVKTYVAEKEMWLFIMLRILELLVSLLCAVWSVSRLTKYQ